MATDLERFVSAPGRDDLVKDVRQQIDAAGVTYIYYQFISVTGRIMGKGVPAAHWESMARKGFQLVYGATANLFVDRHGEYIGYGPEAAELVGLPEPETFQILPWDTKVARVWCTCFRGREDIEDGGSYLTADCRNNLKLIQAAFTEKTGMHLRAGLEPEMMWLKADANGKPLPSFEGMSEPYCYHIDQFSQFQPIIHKVIEYANAMGLDMIQGDHEDAPGQLELNFNFDIAERTADNLSTYRQVCKQVGREMAAFPCFMPKPFMGVSANGCHHNISLWEGDTNKFMPKPDEDQRMPGQIGKWAIGGILEHLGALTAISASTVNSYRRLWDTGFWAPVFADWGFQNRTTALRVSAPGRFEYRSVDSAVNPYLSLAALIKAMEDGIDRQLDPGPPEERNIYQAMEAGKIVKKIPMTFGDALDELDADEVVKSALPGEMYKVFKPLQARRMGALLRDRERLGPRGIPRRPPLTSDRGASTSVCGIAGIIYRNGASDIGSDMTRMLQSMKHRGPDSTGYALYGPTGTGVLVRYKLADSNSPRDFDYLDRLSRHQAEVQSRMESLGAKVLSSHAETDYAYRVTLEYDGDLKKLVDYVEDVPEAEVLSIGHSLEIVKDLGDAETVSKQYNLGYFTGTHAIGHVRMATESDVDISGAHPYWAYPFSDVAVVHNGQLTNYFYWRRRLERSGHRFQSECDSEIIAVYLAERMAEGLTLEEAMRSSLEELDGVFTYMCVTADALGVCKDEMAAKPLVLYEGDDMVAMASEEIAIRAVLDREIETYDPYESEVLVWTR